jgi:hypothetical protein
MTTVYLTLFFSIALNSHKCIRIVATKDVWEWSASTSKGRAAYLLNSSILNSTPVNAWIMQLQAATRGDMW